MARARPRPEAPRPDPTTVVVPHELLAGACIEVWLTPDEITAGLSEYESPNGIPRGILVGLRARRRYIEARAAFLTEHDLHGDDVPEPLRARADRPWSFDSLVANDSDRLTGEITSRGLPSDWHPSPVGPLDHSWEGGPDVPR